MEVALIFVNLVCKKNSKTKQLPMQDSEKARLNEMLQAEMSKLHQLTVTYVEGSPSIRHVETGYLKQALSLCLVLLKFVIEQKVSQLRGQKPFAKDEEVIKSSGKRTRAYLSLFGRLDFSRPSFQSNQRGMIYLVDEHLDIPSSLWSYNIQELVSSNAVQTNFRESVQTMNSLLNLGLNGTSSERAINHLGEEVTAFYEQQAIEKPSGAVFYCASFDGKGVPKIKPLDKTKPKELKRLGKGEKRGIKQMATVGVISYFDPKPRKVSHIISGLMEYKRKKSPEEANTCTASPNDNRWHQAIHRRAFLADQDKSIDYGIGRIKSMINHPQSRIVVPIDAGIGLEDKVRQSLKEHGLEDRLAAIILDIIHVSEYVWDCANAVLGESSNLRTNWVQEMLEDLLNSKTKKVIKDLEKIVAKTKLSKSKKEKVQKAITYFTNHQHKMDYKTYIEKGYPVSSALVESNCKHLVKDRMELSGMRWSSTGAQNMMDMRAVKLNGDLPDFINFIEEQNRKIGLARVA